MKRLKKGQFGIFPAYLCEERHPYQQLLLTWLWKFKNQDDKCWPSLNKLSQISGIGLSTVKKHIKLLEVGGLIIKKQRKVKNSKRWSNNEYDILTEPVGRSPDDHGVGHQMTEGGSPDDHGVGHQMTTKNTSIKNTKEDNLNIIGEIPFSVSEDEEDLKDFLQAGADDVDSSLSEFESEEKGCSPDEQIIYSGRGEYELKKIKTNDWTEEEKMEKGDLRRILRYVECFNGEHVPIDDAIKQLEPIVQWGKDRTLSQQVVYVEDQDDMMDLFFEIGYCVSDRAKSRIYKKAYEYNWCLSVFLSRDTQQALKKALPNYRARKTTKT